MQRLICGDQQWKVTKYNNNFLSVGCFMTENLTLIAHLIQFL